MLKVIDKLIRLQNQLDNMGVLQFVKVLKKQYLNAQVYLVGGSVRDTLLGVKDSKDYDFVVRGVDRQDLLGVLQSLGWVGLVGKKFGVYKFKPDNLKIRLLEPLDIALPRTEISTLGGGYGDFEIHTDENLSIEEDLGRRDFTINAMAWDLFNQKLIDPFNGQYDLSHKKLLTVGNAYERFEEDYSRMLRGIRFACQLKFQIDDVSWKAICDLMGHINDVIKLEGGKHSKSGNLEIRKLGKINSLISEFPNPQISNRIVPYEVIATEMLKALIANPIYVFDLYDKSGAFKQLIPEILKMKDCPQPKEYHTEGDVWEHTRLTLKNLKSRAFEGYMKKVEDTSINANLVLACLLHDVGKAYTIQTPEKDGTDRIRFNGHDREGAKLAKNICKRLKVSAPAKVGADPEIVAWLVKSHMLLLSGDVEKMKATTLEKYFFNSKYRGDDLIKLTIADALATLPPESDPNLDNIDKLLRRLSKLKKLNKEKNRLPKALLDGDEIMKLLGLRPSKKIGELSLLLREEQLNGKVKDKAGAKKFLNKVFKD